MCGSISAHSSSVVSLAYRSPSRRYLMRVISVHDILGSPSLLTPRQNHKWLESLNSIFGQPLRYSTIILICVGGLMPIIDGVAVSLFDYQNISRLGYVFLGLGLALLSFDRFSGTFNTWIRYVATGFKLQTLLTEFQMDWS